MHFRNVQTPVYKENLDGPGAPFNPKFLEPVTEDLPKGLWTVQNDESRKNAVVRSLMWPGFSFFHKKQSQKFGNLYIGDGLKNADLHFMI